ncbi:hypothetical protein ACGFJ7_40110 [Actinoplanes sp. NPDC048988]|uniref:hypothetical protein n=1 Tax=Actinoplanes sp. NPDC048988 TaxID=3363901 RepID=UPI00371C6070
MFELESVAVFQVEPVEVSELELVEVSEPLFVAAAEWWKAEVGRAAEGVLGTAAAVAFEVAAPTLVLRA